MPNTAIDILFIVIILLSAVLAFVRGFIRESLALGTWLLATYLSFTQFHLLVPYLEEKIHNPMLRDAAAGAGVFAIVMIVLVPITFYIRSFIKGESITAIDRSFGFLFGAARGFLLISIFYLIGTWLVAEDHQPEWMKEAKTRPLMEYGANLIRDVIPEEQRKMFEKKTKEAGDKVDDAAASAGEPTAPAGESLPPPKDSGTNQFDETIGDIKKGP